LPFRIEILPDEEAVAARAADEAAAALRKRLAGGARALAMFAAGRSQIRLLDRLAAAPGIDWGRVDLCHLDEYVGVGADHPGGLVRFLEDHLAARVRLGSALWIDGRADPQAECARLKRALAGRTVDLALLGIGENGHIGFNEPPADFAATEPYLVVDLAEATRLQQVGEGWFPDDASVPRRAVTASVPFILAARQVLCLATGPRKAVAVRACFAGPVAPEFPASALRGHPDAALFLDRESAFFLPQPLP
jgi:glucosamine-6-phosphate deaminase